MPPLPAEDQRTLQATGARRKAPRVPSRTSVVETLRALGNEGGGLVALLDADAIGGERHLLSAWAHLGRARARGEGRLRDRAAEFALYVAGDDQLPRALAKVGVSDSTEGFVLVAEKPRSVSQLLIRFDLDPDPTVYPRPPGESTLERLGITESDRATVSRSSWEGLILERVALIELTAPHAGSPGAKH